MNDFGPYADREDIDTLALLLKNSYDQTMLQCTMEALADPEMQKVWVLRRQHADGVKHFAHPVSDPRGMYFACCGVQNIFGVDDKTRDDIWNLSTVQECAVEGAAYQWREGDSIMMFEQGSVVFPELKAEMEKGLQETGQQLAALGESSDPLSVEQYTQLGTRFQFLQQKNNPMSKLLAALESAGIAAAVEVGIPGVEAAQLAPNEDKPTLH